MTSPNIYHPKAPLDDLVECFWSWDGSVTPPLRERALPSGTLDLVINLGEDRLCFYANDEPSSKFELPGASSGETAEAGRP
jgi:hypothetical protein